jgi:sugar fermentation stimulation protein A
VDLRGEREYVHVPDPGRLRELLLPGRPVWLRAATAGARRTRYSLVMTQDRGHWVSLDTSVPNRVVRAALLRGEIPAFSGYHEVRPEQRYGESRLDFLLIGPPGRCLLEVKSVTLVVDGLGLFPDAVSDRASRHLRELARAAGEGYRAAVLFVVQRDDAAAVAANADTDPDFAKALAMAVASGVEALAMTCTVTSEGIDLGTRVPVLAGAWEGVGSGRGAG